MIQDSKYKISHEDFLKAYRDMVILRKFEEKAGQIYGMGLIGGFCHLYIGQEAVAVGAYIAKNKDDSVVTTYRCHGQAILSGIEPKYVLAELMGKETGCSKGKGGSMHLFNKEGKFFGGHGIVGGSVPLGAGIAFSEYYRNTKNACITFLGDGAINQGQVYEAFNMAALWKLPALFIIENNEYSMGTSVSRSTAMTDLYKKGESFGIDGVKINGMNFVEVHDTIKDCLEKIRNGSGPKLIEVKTYRYRGHSMSDPGKYRTKEEVEKHKNEDPIETLKEYLIKNNICNDSVLKTIDNDVKSIVTEAVDFATNSNQPDISELFTDIYINTDK
jgi:pyruvate dehydrogenase E1 component alpha subunit